MNKFSIRIMPDKLKLYKCSREEYKNIISKYNLYNIDDVLSKTFLEDEITIYYLIKNTTENHYNHHILSKICVTDPRPYTIINIYEDIPGIDHVGIIHKISSLFLENNIPILYINTYGHNIILVADEYIDKAIHNLKKIGNFDL